MKAKLGIIGGTGFYELKGLEIKRKVSLENAIVTDRSMISGDIRNKYDLFLKLFLVKKRLSLVK